MASTAEDYAYAARYNLVLYNTHDDIERERFYISSVIQRSVDGALFVSAQDESTGPQMLRAAGIPAVVIDRVPRDYDGPAVLLDNTGAGRMAGEHLLSLGHTHIVHVGGPTNVHIARERLAGFRQALKARDVQANRPAEAAGDWRIESGYAAMQDLLRRNQGFTAVFAAGDLLAIGAMRALREAGLRVPEDVSVMGIDDIDIAAFLWPPLTTVSQSIAHMATLGVQLLLDILEDKEVPGRTVIEPRLIVRESTAPPRAVTVTGHSFQGE
jgi:LacI family transcriptional regulator